MAGRKRTAQAIHDYVNPRAELTEQTPLDWVLDQIRDGVSLTKLARDINRAQQMTCKRVNVLRWMEMQAGGPAELQGRLDAALKDSAGACVDIAGDVIGALGEREQPPTREEIAYAKLVAEHHQWRAGIYDRNRFGARPEHATLNITQLHLTALMNVMPKDAPPDVRQVPVTAGTAVLGVPGEDLL